MFKNCWIYILFLSVLSFSVNATEPVAYGKIKTLTYRGGWVMFTMVGADNVNYCSTCPADPGAQGTQKCWIEETKSAQLSMLLAAQARDKMVRGRVISLTQNCNLYEMVVQD